MSAFYLPPHWEGGNPETIYLGDGAAAGAGAAVAGCGPLTCNDFIKAISWISCSGLTCPWNVGMIGPNPVTNLAPGFSIDSRM